MRTLPKMRAIPTAADRDNGSWRKKIPRQAAERGSARLRVEAVAAGDCGCVLMQGTAVQAGAVLKYAITDKNVRVNPGRMLMGHNTYPLSIAKNEIV